MDQDLDYRLSRVEMLLELASRQRATTGTDGLMSYMDKAALDTAVVKLAGLARPQLRLAYTAVADVYIGAVAGGSYTDMGAAQPFSVTSANSVLIFEVRASIQVVQSAGGNVINLRAQIDGTGGTKLTSASVPVAGSAFLNGATFIGNGFAAGAHTFKVQVYVVAANGTIYCRPGTQPATETLEYRIWEIAP